MITVSPLTPPVASFSTNATSGKIPLSVQFTDTSTNTPTGWIWQWGDGTANTTGTGTPIHAFTVAGVYQVNLTATNADGSNLSANTAITAQALTPPVANFTSNTTSTKVNKQIQFNDTSSNTPTSWQWQWGDGTANGTTVNPIHSYSSVGVYSVNLTATNADGSGSIEKANYITISALTPPIANFSVNNTYGFVPLPIQFTDTSTGGTPTSWDWQFGDGSANSTLQDPVHIYGIGTYTINLTVSNADGSSSVQYSNLILVDPDPIPVANFYAMPTNGAAPLTVNFFDTSTNYPMAWNWSFGDGVNSTTQSPSHVYSTPGTYTVTLSAWNTNGTNTRVIANMIVVSAPTPTPTPTPTATPTPVPVPPGGNAAPYQIPDVPFPTVNTAGIHMISATVNNTTKTVTFLGKIDNTTLNPVGWFMIGDPPGQYSYFTVAYPPNATGYVTIPFGTGAPLIPGEIFYVRMGSQNGRSVEELTFTTPAATPLPTSNFSQYFYNIQYSNHSPLTMLAAVPLPLVDLFGAGNTAFGWEIFFTIVFGIICLVLVVRQDSIVLVFEGICIAAVLMLGIIDPEFIWIIFAFCAIAAATILYRLYRRE
jgi:PKD repeat protein